uniref:Magnesium-protoporphyrin IX monomethyl ester [oxidative] cyclase n=2 Tax=Gracilariopsis TaxID=2781 RepID=A0A0C5DLJ0_GRALE|nr:magnesium-protoporphyrin IX monomethyl ester cyclase [Gracilariopsis lemaneiformis]YP_009294611.1 Magnesium-protoporphyrin IX monomethyl ester oxidative cyclase [Gracilariopsis chorda]AJO68452.1 magnesium-protoporphyrin IX monomethyl ester cyclase [Gracilariopsis lemaneiformis]AML79964.1 magnesium-protoporphyrin IX monomethyl ester cyclase [Gracilariopsis lemaneiformis]AOM66871.1 Magnesium-protoporphyrin IX monomethyl ester oxidative cyclase [Gracilariopsis chorda]UAD88868.1 Mg-protoporphyr
MQNSQNLSKVTAKETLLTPRFYTTDFKEMAKLDISLNIHEFQALLEEFRADYNRQHFIRDEEFEQSWNNLDKTTKALFIEFLERSCTAEFSGFLLYKELSRRLENTNPIIAECFLLMSRDEARHAGFLNKAISDFNLSLDLGFLTKTRKYTFFSPKFIFYATYLSEKIGYWRYITIYRHLEKYPEHRIYPIFKFFENWCQDENRHGDFFAALLKSQPQFLNNLEAKLWCRFFLLSVFATMYLNDFQRSDFYKSIGLDARQYDIQVIRKTNESASRIFPIALNVDKPEFFQYLDKCASENKKLTETDKKHQIYLIKTLMKIPIYIKLSWYLIKLYCLPTIPSSSIISTIR